MRLWKLLRLSCLEYTGKAYNCRVGCIVQDEKEARERVREHPLFICLAGTRFDSHSLVDSLYRDGVRCFVVEKEKFRSEMYPDASFIIVENGRLAMAKLARAFFGFPDKKLTMVGVTGTKGKTTVTYMLESVFSQFGKKCGIIGTNGAFFQGEKIETVNSTPGAIELFGILGRMVDKGVEYVFCEVTSQALKQYRVYGITFDVAAFTNLFCDHIGEYEHSDFEDYRYCKGLLFSACRYAVLNRDDGEFEYFEKICTENKVEYDTFSLKEANEVFPNGIKLRLPGEFNVYNALCAFAVSKRLGVPCGDIIRGLELASVPGRCERVENPAGIQIVIDYAHSGESLENILSALRKECRGRLICVFGAGGDRAKTRRSGMGKAASEFSDFSIITSDNPRGEELESIISDILSGITCDAGKYSVIPDRRDAIFYALSLAKPGDMVLLAGKGTQRFQEIKGVRHHFDEREVVAQYYTIIQ